MAYISIHYLQETEYAKGRDAVS